MSCHLHFQKEEKLKSLKAIGKLFEQGTNVFVYPLKAMYGVSEERNTSGACIGISVPKKNRKKAHDRNLIKRRIKEAYRLNNEKFKQELMRHNIPLDIMFIYIEREEVDYIKIEGSVIKCLSKIQSILINVTQNDKK